MTQLSHETKAYRKLFLRIQRKRLLWYNRTMSDSDYALVIRPDPSPSSPEGVQVGHALLGQQHRHRHCVRR